MTAQPEATERTDDEPASGQVIARTLHWAWAVWGTLLLITLALLAATTVVLVVRTPDRAGESDAAERWAWFVAAYYVIVVPAAFFYRGRLFRGYYRYEPVPPRTYLRGMSVMWAALAVGAWLALAGCLGTRTFLPNILLAGVGNVMLLALWPKGNSMTRPVGNPGDTGKFQEPR